VIQTVIQEPEPKPTRDVGAGVYDVTVELHTEAEVYHTIAERIQRIREKEIQTWQKGKPLSNITVSKHQCMDGWTVKMRDVWRFKAKPCTARTPL